MAFHVACPVTCQRICFCELGFAGRLRSEKGRGSFLEEVSRAEELLADPWSFGDGRSTTVQVVVPRIPAAAAVDGSGAALEETRTGQTKRAALQRIAAAASLAAEDYARKFEAGNLEDTYGETPGDHNGEDQGSSASKLMCRICFSGESEGSKRATRMLACRLCNKKYHRKCLKSWAAFRDLFHWSSWVCPSCRSCEVCRRTGDPNKFMFCKRCDVAYHCYCQQPPHKKVTPGPFLCPRHTRCYSCGSPVSGSGSSTRWWLGYTFCDACGRLFVKGNYCPVCLKVYRDSESIPMVCCDVCQRWVHCQCDGISDAKYLQFQNDRNLHYKCAACRGDCYQVNDIDDAVEELWRRRDRADHNQIASSRAAAGLPYQEDIFSICPYSDDEENDSVIVKCDYGRPYRFFVKGLVEKATKDTKKLGKTGKNMTKKRKVPLTVNAETPLENSKRVHKAQQLADNWEEKKTIDMKSYETKGSEVLSSSVTTSPVKYNDDSLKQAVPRAHNISSSVSHALELEKGNVKRISKTEMVKGTKLVIHLVARNSHETTSPSSELLACSRGQDLAAASNEVKLDSVKQLKGLMHQGKPRTLKLDKVEKSEAPKLSNKTSSENIEKESKSTSAENTLVLLERTEGINTIEEHMAESTLRNEEVLLHNHSRSTFSSLCGEKYNGKFSPSFSGLKGPKSLLKLKFKNPYFESQNSWALVNQEANSFVKGHRSKRKRSSPLRGKVLSAVDVSDDHVHQETKPLSREDEGEGHMLMESPVDDDMDANWILKKLGKDAKGKRVEVYRLSDDTWHKGMVIDMIEGTSSMSVRFDDGRSKTLELGRQRVRFISKKQKK